MMAGHAVNTRHHIIPTPHAQVPSSPHPSKWHKRRVDFFSVTPGVLFRNCLVTARRILWDLVIFAFAYCSVSMFMIPVHIYYSSSSWLHGFPSILMFLVFSVRYKLQFQDHAIISSPSPTWRRTRPSMVSEIHYCIFSSFRKLILRCIHLHGCSCGSSILGLNPPDT